MTGAAGAKILIVDDEEDILSSLKALLEAYGNWEIHTAPGGKEAISLMKEHQFKLVISDYRMPVMDGLEFLGEARKSSQSLPLILMTAFPDLQIAIDSINSIGIHNFFTKPLDPTEIVEVISTVLADEDREKQRDLAFARAMKLAGERE